ncbi:MAG: hypothetical protein V4693_23530 [Pseudomonadota bacterium]
MNSNQRSQDNNQSDNGGNELDVSSSRAGSQDDVTAKRDGLAREHESNDAAGSYPQSPAGHHLAADQKMDDDTGLSNTVNQPPENPNRQDLQSNVGRRSDGTPD